MALSREIVKRKTKTAAGFWVCSGMLYAGLARWLVVRTLCAPRAVCHTILQRLIHNYLKVRVTLVLGRGFLPFRKG